MLLSACFPQPAFQTVHSQEGGRLLIYLQPMTSQGTKLRCILDSIWAKKEDGTKIPLTLLFHELNEDLPGRQKRLAFTSVPHGAFSGIAVHIKSASVQGEEGEAALLVPDEPVNVNLAFDVSDRQVTALFLTLDTVGSITSAVKFAPRFGLEPAKKILTNLTGYVSNSEENYVSVFNKKTMQVVGAIATGREPKGLALDQRRGKLYIAAAADDAIDIVDVFERKVVERISLHFGDGPMELALSPDKQTMLAVNSASNTISVIDTAALLETARIPVGERPVSAVIHPSGLKAFVMNSFSNSISVIDLTRNETTATLPVDGRPERAAFNQRGTELYVIGPNSPRLTILDPARLRVVKTIFVGMGNVAILADNKTDLVLVGCEGLSGISVISSTATMYIDQIQIEAPPAHMAMDNEENMLFMVLPSRKTLQKMNPTSKKSLAEIDVGQGAYAVAVMGER